MIELLDTKWKGRGKYCTDMFWVSATNIKCIQNKD